jgi:DNA-binding transcriptional MocR family regulator
MNPLPVVQTQTPPEVIDLGAGNPSLSVLPLDLIHEAAKVALSKNDTSFLQYGVEQGNGYLRESLANFLTSGYGFPVDAENLFITSGISNALDLLCTLFTREGDTIFVEEPTYFLALRIFRDHHLTIVPIATDEHGLIPASLEGRLASATPKFLYLVPTFQNPSGHTLSQERREQILQLAERHNFLIAADEVYQLLNFAGKPPTSFGAYVDSERVLSLGSFSKILAPGLRLGWIQAHPKLIGRFTASGLLDSGGGLNPFTSAIVREVVESGALEKHIRGLTSRYADQAKTMDEALRRHLPQATYAIPDGGYFVWLRFPESVNTSELRKRAPSFNVDFRPGALFSSNSGMKNFMRVCFVFYGSDQIEEGVQRLGELYLSSAAFTAAKTSTMP